MIAMCTLATNSDQRGRNVLDFVICVRSYGNHLRPKGEGEALDGVNADLYDEAADPI